MKIAGKEFIHDLFNCKFFYLNKSSMEKFSKFKDPFTGINPFIAPKYGPITFRIVLKALLKLPLWILYTMGLPTLPYIIKINRKTSTVPSRLVYANSVCCFDRNVIAFLYGIKTFSNIGLGTRVVFPEGASTNNKGILDYPRREECDYVIGLKYSNECINIGIKSSLVGRLAWLLRFLGRDNYVDVTCLRGFELDKAAGMPRLSLNSRAKDEFLKLV